MRLPLFESHKRDSIRLTNIRHTRQALCGDAQRGGSLIDVNAFDTPLLQSSSDVLEKKFNVLLLYFQNEP